ncbi:hypothetical protein C9374_014646 [Naegleria lovaniensis]|uniref:Methyltransferase domain-containing protein n=1 Tax=Naegleria lovaniensis TaxID=51637 RepID=A0AA88KQ25_NAELO|nr:uncharacterized protein C9374_014646 [Naegleria lovaniensis]KAG2389246.1 hypothetical protein C9374_014646 [Naegleria lovaniensis]
MQPPFSFPSQASPNHRILNDDDLKNKYNATFSKVFQEIYEPSTNITAQSLISSLGINTKKHILDIGCGAGGSGFLIASQMPPNAELVCMDLSPDMIQLARERCDILTREPFSRKIQFVEGSAEKLPFADESFDAVFSNYCLHVIPNPDHMLSEVGRVLKHGGMACLSVWGRPEKSPLFTILQKATVECKKRFLNSDSSSESSESSSSTPPPPPPRSQFHLCHRELLRERVLNTTILKTKDCSILQHKENTVDEMRIRVFSQCLAWYQFQPFQAFDAREFAELNILSPEFQNLIRGSEEKRQQVLQLLEEMALEIMKSTSEPIGNEALIVWMKKD